jgi:hypothetical protein
MITKLFQELNNEKIDISPILDNLNIDKVKSADIYFNNKDMIPINSRPALYEKIMDEIININEKIYNENIFEKENIYLQNENKNIDNSNDNSNNLGIIKEENTISILKGEYSKNQSKGNDNSVKQNLDDIDEDNNIKNISRYYNENVMNNNNLNQNIKKNNNMSILDIPNKIIVKNILLYLDIKSVCPFSLVNKKCNQCYKNNMFLRLLILDNHKQIFENVNEEYINSINLKRNNFFSDYEIEPPNKEHSLQLMSQLKNKDITELKSIFRKYNSLNEILVSPFVLLLGEKPKKSHVNGQKKIIYFSIAQKLLNDRKINKKIKDINLETIPNNIFKDIEKIFQNDAFNFNKMKGYSPCLYNLICWEMGVIEYHRTVRNFCLNYYDMKILSKEEIIFCGQMDNINIMYNKLKYYSYTFCREFENDAMKIMMEINSRIYEDNDEYTNNNEENYQEESEKINKINEINNDIENTNSKEINTNENINELEDSIENNNS